MRLAHLADPHLGFRQYHRLTARGQNQRESDVAQAFSRAIDGVIAQAPDAVVVAGDIFHAVRPTNAAILHAVREFTRLQRELPRVPVIVIAGNHDTPRSSDTVSIFGLLHEIGVYVAHDRARRFDFQALDLAVLAVPHQALFEQPRPALEPSGDERYQVLVLHGETPGLFGDDRTLAEPGGAYLTTADLTGGAWSYVALGHYHVQHEVQSRVWYSGALDYVSPNSWGELREERHHLTPGKGWLLVDLDTGVVTPQPIVPPRRVIDLPWLDAAGLAAGELDRLMAEAIAVAPGGIDDAVVRLVVRNVPRAVAREVDHAAIRSWKTQALHLHLDLRRPTDAPHRSGSGAPGGRQTLAELVTDYLGDRRLPPGMDRGQFVAEGQAFLESVEHEPEER